MSRPRGERWPRRQLPALLLGLGALPFVASAQTLVTEVIPIGYRDAAELLPVIRPLVPAPGSVGAISNQLVVRTTPDNLAEIRQVLASLDRAPVNLLVSVRHTVNEAVRRDLLAAGGRLRSGGVGAEVGSGGAGISAGGVGADDGVGVGVGVGVRIVQTSRDQDERDVQSVRVIEGREAFIRSGESVPLADRRVVVTGAGTVSVQEGVRYEDVDSGFYVLPRLAGDTVTVEISPHRRKRSASGGGALDVQAASTVVSGPLGMWLEVGSVRTSSTRESSGIGYSASTGSRGDRGIFLKVERLP